MVLDTFSYMRLPCSVKRIRAAVRAGEGANVASAKFDAARELRPVDALLASQKVAAYSR
jgi:hypothetical protein